MNQETKTCQNCKASFEIDASDFDFYAKIKVPPPTWCPECRMVRRMNWRNERTLYKRKCNAPGHNEEIISIYHKDSPFKIYDQKYWWSDEWDAMSYGKDYDFNKPFFEQFKELLLNVPHNNLFGANNINSDYVNYQDHSKDCYLVTGGSRNEAISYVNNSFDSKDSLDLYFINKMELSYDDVVCQSSYKLFFSQNCDNCGNSYFLYDCRNCQSCFGCVGLRNKQYHIFNKPYSKEDYESKLKEFNLGSFSQLKKQKELFNELKLKHPHKFANLIKTVDTTGDNAVETKNCKSVFDVLPGVTENAKFAYWLGSGKDMYDGTGFGVDGELLYEDVSVAINVARIFFTVAVWGGYDIQYSYNCHNSCYNLFGCVGLRGKSYCILNKQYTKESYEKLIPQIIDHMNNMPYISKIQKSNLKSQNDNPKFKIDQNSESQTREIIYHYGEFFPPELSPFAYNETIAQEYFPLTKEQAIDKGYSWKDPEERNIQITIKSEDIPDHIKDIQDDIIDQIIECANSPSQISKRNLGGQASQCTQAFKIIQPELDFYKKMNLPLPRLCPNCRHYQRLKQRNPLKLWKRKCQCAGTQSDNKIYQNTITHTHNQNHCENEFETTYSPNRQEIIYCEKCYQKEVI